MCTIAWTSGNPTLTTVMLVPASRQSFFFTLIFPTVTKIKICLRRFWLRYIKYLVWCIGICVSNEIMTDYVTWYETRRRLTNMWWTASALSRLKGEICCVNISALWGYPQDVFVCLSRALSAQRVTVNVETVGSITEIFSRFPLTLRLLISYIYIYIYIWSTYSWCF